MQSPNPAPNPVEVSVRQGIRHEFSPAQLEMVQFYRQQLAAAEQKLLESRMAIGLFLDFVRKEKGLPDDGINWTLGLDPDGKPYLSGARK